MPQYRIAYLCDKLVTYSIQIIKCRLVKLGSVFIKDVLFVEVVNLPFI